MLFHHRLLSAVTLLGAVVSAAKPKEAAVLDAAHFRSLQKNGLIKLDSSSYDDITKSPRDYSVSILLTALGKQFNCAQCHQVQPEYELLASQWQSHQKKADETHFFAVLDFTDGQQIYQRFGLQTAPTFQTYLPTEGPRATERKQPLTVDLARLGLKAEGIVKWVKENAQIPYEFSRPIDKSKLLGTIFILATFGVTVWRASSFLKLILSQTYIWAAGTIVIILLMTGGYMWNQIRNPPYSQIQKDGSVMYIQPGYSSQFVAETHIIAACYGLLGFSTYTLAFILPQVKDPFKQRVGVYTWTLISVVMAGVVMSIFKVKQGGYPFKIF